MRCFAFLILGAIIPLGPRCAEDGLLGDFVMGAVLTSRIDGTQRKHLAYRQFIGK